MLSLQSVLNVIDKDERIEILECKGLRKELILYRGCKIDIEGDPFYTEISDIDFNSTEVKSISSRRNLLTLVIVR